MGHSAAQDSSSSYLPCSREVPWRVYRAACETQRRLFRKSFWNTGAAPPVSPELIGERLTATITGALPALLHHPFQKISAVAVASAKNGTATTSHRGSRIRIGTAVSLALMRRLRVAAPGQTYWCVAPCPDDLTVWHRWLHSSR